MSETSKKVFVVECQATGKGLEVAYANVRGWTFMYPSGAVLRQYSFLCSECDTVELKDTVTGVIDLIGRVSQVNTVKMNVLGNGSMPQQRITDYETAAFSQELAQMPAHEIIAAMDAEN